MNLTTSAYNTIRSRIVSCEYAPGSFLNEELLAAELKLSRTPIRDALGRLEQEGLITIKPKKGILVNPLTAGMVNMIFEVRLLFEPYILQNYGVSLPKERLEEFYILSQTYGSRPSTPNEVIYQLDTDFHSMIVGACTNTYILQSYAMINAQNERFRHMTGNVSDTRLRDTSREHIGILQSCLESDWTEAAEKLRLHLENSKQASFALIFQEADGADPALFSSSVTLADPKTVSALF